MIPIVARILDFIYPAYCQVCSTQLSYGKSLCNVCLGKLVPVEAPLCSQCGECFDGDIDSQFTCNNCHGLNFSFNFARAAYRGDKSSRQLIHDFKYSRQIHLAENLATLTSLALGDSRFLPFLKNGILVPVPLHWLRQRKRRFNQSEEIVKHLARQVGMPWANILKRTRNTETQTRYNRKKRLQNLNGAFQLRRNGKALISNRMVILVDDVLTTGSTANECAVVLLENGASEVAVLTLIRG
ncbi:MAG: ComF family protein [Akkermansiaceae bacterium]|nr:ComF family protein [Akkermansiaceae bacterium]